MIIGIWRAKRNPTTSLDEYKKLQREVVIPGIKAAPGCLGVFNFYSDTEWGTVQIWESREADLAADASPYAQRIFETLQASGLMPAEGESSYEWFEVHSGFAVQDLFEKYIK